LIATSSGAAARGRSERVVNENSGPEGTFFAGGLSALDTNTWYVVPGSSGTDAVAPFPLGVTVGVTSSAPFGPTMQNAPVGLLPWPAQLASLL
jgi:hypothetical protein